MMLAFPVGIRERLSECKGQSMTEYVMILAAIAVVVCSAYQSMGNGIGNLLGNLTNYL